MARRLRLHALQLCKCLYLAACTVGAVASSAAAEPLQQAPRRIDNVWDGRHHEPNPSSVERQERADGLETLDAARKNNRTTEEIARTLLRDEAATSRQRKQP